MGTKGGTGEGPDAHRSYMAQGHCKLLFKPTSALALSDAVPGNCFQQFLLPFVLTPIAFLGYLYTCSKHAQKIHMLRNSCGGAVSK